MTSENDVVPDDCRKFINRVTIELSDCFSLLFTLIDGFVEIASQVRMMSIDVQKEILLLMAENAFSLVHTVRGKAESVERQPSRCFC